MPTYEYACRDCGEHLEVVQSFRDDPLTECPNCTGTLRKVFSATGIIFKGSGWHIKDYKSGSSAPSTSSSSDTKSDTGDAGTSSSGKDKDKGSDKSASTSSTTSDTTASSSSTPAAKSA